MQFFKQLLKKSPDAIFNKQLKNVLGIKPGSALLYRTALSHRSVKETADENNERLEYLGDAVLSAIVADYLFKRYPYKGCLLYTSPSPRDRQKSRMPSSA